MSYQNYFHIGNFGKEEHEDSVLGSIQDQDEGYLGSIEEQEMDVLRSIMEQEEEVLREVFPQIKSLFFSFKVSFSSHSSWLLDLLSKIFCPFLYY